MLIKIHENSCLWFCKYFTKTNNLSDENHEREKVFVMAWQTVTQVFSDSNIELAAQLYSLEIIKYIAIMRNKHTYEMYYRYVLFLLDSIFYYHILSQQITMKTSASFYYNVVSSGQQDKTFISDCFFVFSYLNAIISETIFHEIIQYYFINIW